MSERIHFYPFLRHGWAGAALPEDSPQADPDARAVLTVDLSVNDDPAVHANVTLLGPGDVTAIGRRNIIRTDPAPHARGVEPNYLPCIDFDRPDFPWMFTPASAGAQGRLRPWLCLVVVRKKEGVSLQTGGSRPVGLLSITEPADFRTELPDLSQSWGWAHAQVAAFEGSLDAALASHPDRSLSRIICPRLLEPNADYIACLVPAFEAGRLAGLGFAVTVTDLQPAWRQDADEASAVLLPVYYHWEFSTGAGGDFASLAKLLRPEPVKSETGTAALDVGSADQRLPAIPQDSADRVLRMEGALTAPNPSRHGFTGEDGAAFQRELAVLLDQPDSPDEDPILAPPVYGDRHAGLPELPPAGSPPPWIRELNLDPRYRAVSALGTRVVQEHQEEMLASVWRQAGEIGRANTILRQAQFLKTVGESVLQKRMTALPPGSLLQITRGVQGRLADGASTLRLSVDAHAIAKPIATPQFRRIARPRGPRLRSVVPASARTVRPIFGKVAGGTITMLFRPVAGGMVTLESVERRYRETGGVRPPGEQVAFTFFANADPASLPKRPAFEVRTPEPFLPPDVRTPPLAPPGATDSFPAGRLRAAWASHGPALRVPPIFLTAPAPLRLDALRSTAIAQLNPALLMSGRLQKIVSAPDTGPRPDPFDPILATPELERPMYETLRDLFPTLMLPGLNGVEDNRAALLVTNPRFVEAFLVGLNHELGRELLWRGFPARSRFTYFRRFWDRRGHPGAGALPNDIPPIVEWTTQHLGELAASSDGQAVVLVRGELTRRYPNAIYYLGEAERRPGSTKLTLGTREMHPQFRGRLGHDVLFFGFALSDAAVKGGPSHPGWYFVIQEAPGEPRFGVEATATPGAFLEPAADAAQTARQFLRQPVRVALHGATLLP